MPFADSQGCRIYYRLEGAATRPLLVLAHALGSDHGLWDPQMSALSARFQVLRLDLRGHGAWVLNRSGEIVEVQPLPGRSRLGNSLQTCGLQPSRDREGAVLRNDSSKSPDRLSTHGASDAPPGGYTIAQLGRDVLTAIDTTLRGRFAYCGLSLGGMIGQWLGANAGGRIDSLVLANTSPRMADPALFETRRTTVLERGAAAIEEAAMSRFFSVRTPAAESIRNTLLATNAVGYAGCCAAIRDTSLLANIKVPVLVIGGDNDASTPWTGHGDVLARGIAGARIAKIGGAHLSNLERPSTFTAALFDFLTPLAAGAIAAGSAVRRAVLGDEHVDRAIAGTTDFTREFQDMIARFVWGAVWTRPGLDPKLPTGLPARRGLRRPGYLRQRRGPVMHLRRQRAPQQRLAGEPECQVAARSPGQSRRSAR